MQVGPLEILVILVIALLIFGPNKLPELARTVGKGLRELRQLQRMVQRELDDAMAEAPAKPAPKPTAPSSPPTTSAGDGANGSGTIPRPATPAPRTELDPPAVVDDPTDGS